MRLLLGSKLGNKGFNQSLASIVVRLIKSVGQQSTQRNHPLIYLQISAPRNGTSEHSGVHFCMGYPLGGGWLRQVQGHTDENHRTWTPMSALQEGVPMASQGTTAVSEPVVHQGGLGHPMTKWETDLESFW